MDVLSLASNSCHLVLEDCYTTSADLDLCSVARACLLDKKVSPFQKWVWKLSLVILWNEER